MFIKVQGWFRLPSYPLLSPEHTLSQIHLYDKIYILWSPGWHKGKQPQNPVKAAGSPKPGPTPRAIGFSLVLKCRVFSLARVRVKG